MKFEILKVIRSVPLKEYSDGYGDESLHVWVNPPREFQRRREELDVEYVGLVRAQLQGEKERENRMDEAKDDEAREQILKENADAAEKFKADIADFNARNFGWYAECWSQAKDAHTHWSVDEIQELYEQEPALCSWMAERTLDLLQEQREQQKKG